MWSILNMAAVMFDHLKLSRLVGLFVHLSACFGLQCNYRSVDKRFQDLPAQLCQIHAACKCRRLPEPCLQNSFKDPIL